MSIVMLLFSVIKQRDGGKSQPGLASLSNNASTWHLMCNVVSIRLFVVFFLYPHRTEQQRKESRQFHGIFDLWKFGRIFLFEIQKKARAWAGQCPQHGTQHGERELSEPSWNAFFCEDVEHDIYIFVFVGGKAAYLCWCESELKASIFIPVLHHFAHLNNTKTLECVVLATWSLPFRGSAKRLFGKGGQTLLSPSCP